MIGKIKSIIKTAKSTRLKDQAEYINRDIDSYVFPNVLYKMLAIKMMSYAVNNVDKNNKNEYCAHHHVSSFCFDDKNIYVSIGMLLTPTSFSNCGDWIHHVNYYKDFWVSKYSSASSIDNRKAFDAKTIFQCINIDIDSKNIFHSKKEPDENFLIYVTSPQTNTGLNLHDSMIMIEEAVATMNQRSFDERYSFYVDNDLIKYTKDNFFGYVTEIKKLSIELFRSIINSLESGLYVDENLIFHYSYCLNRDSKSLLRFYRDHASTSSISEESLKNYIIDMSDSNEKTKKYIKVLFNK